MDTYFYYITCKGQKKGPYKFYQLQQLKTEEKVSPDDFNPEEWDEFSRFVQTGQMSSKGGKAHYIRRADDNSQAERPLLKYLTYASYCVGLAFVVGGLVQGHDDYLLTERASFILGLIFTAGLCQSFVKRAVHQRLEKSAQMATPVLLMWYLGGLAPMAAIIAITSVIMQMKWPERQTMDVGMKFLAAGALFSLYWPFHLRTVAIDHHLPPKKSHSILWLIALVFTTALAAFYFAPKPQEANLARAHEFLFAEVEKPRDADGAWQFPVKIGDNAKTVQRFLGQPTETNGRDELIYKQTGIRVFMDERRRVSKLRFITDEQSSFYKTRILFGISPSSNFSQIKKLLQNAPPAVFSDEFTQTCIWDEQGYRITACFWKKDFNKDGKEFKEGNLKWIEITPEGV